MKKKALALLLSLSMLSSFMVPAFAAEPDNGASTEEAVYLGIKDFANSHGDNKDNFEYLFSVNGATETYKVANDEYYSIQNQLMEGYIYNITVEDGTVTDAEILYGDVAGEVTGFSDSGNIYVDGELFYIEDFTKTWKITSAAGGATVTEGTAQKGDTVRIFVDEDDNILRMYTTFVAEDYTAPVSGVPGLKTLKNFLATAMEPVGTSLYVYGGTWDWQDENSSNQAMTIGLPQSWIDFFQSHDETYTYRNDDDPAHSYYWRHYNEYYYGGPDCSGYVGWTLYNLMNTESSTVSENEGFVGSATSQAGKLADRGWGAMDMGDQLLNEDGTPWVDKNGVHRGYDGHDFKTGDVFSMNGHVWICFGTCDDGSIVFLHSTPNTTGGAGAQISAIGPDKNCEAYQLANRYMNQYYPAWSKRYGDQVLCLTFDGYTRVYGDTAGKFSWDLNGEITDPDGYADMTPAEILADLFDTYDGEAVYLGIKGYGDRNVNYYHKPTLEHQFFVDGAVRTFTVDDADNYAIQNVLQEGYIYDIEVDANEVISATMLDKGNNSVVMGKVSAVDGSSITVGETELTIDNATKTWKITSQAGGSKVESAAVTVGDSAKVIKQADAAESIYITFVAADYTAPVSGIPGVKTLRNFLATAMEPVGTALYVYGGTWDWQDMNSSNQAMTIGLSQSWIDFFQSQNANYSYKTNSDHAHSYYPHEAWNQYYYAGIDCSGYVGWAVYNVMNTESATVTGSEGYVCSATKMAKAFSDNGWGTLERTTENGFKVGDVFSMSGHVWICLGTCDDGSIVFMHSTPSDSKTGQGGGGVQISALDPNGSKDCEAYQLADFYMKAYYPEWSERYEPVLRDYSSYTAIASNANAGKFSWTLTDAGLTDPDGYATKKPAEILKDLFGNYTVYFESNGGSAVETQYVTKDGAGVVAKPDDPTRSGYRFIGWYADAELKNVYDFEQTVTDNLVLYAKWERKSSGGSSSGGSSSGPDKEEANKGFSDVDQDDWYYDAVMEAAEKGIMDGVTDKRFDPNGPITRAMLAQILYSQNGKPAADKDGTLVDVPANAWYADAMYWAKAAGAMNGYGDGRMGLTDLLTREQLAVVLYSYAKKNGVDVSKQSDLTKYSDSEQVADWAQDAMSWAVGAGLISGRTAATLAPKGTATRAEAAQIMVHFLKIAK